MGSAANLIQFVERDCCGLCLANMDPFRGRLGVRVNSSASRQLASGSGWRCAWPVLFFPEHRNRSYGTLPGSSRACFVDDNATVLFAAQIMKLSGRAATECKSDWLIQSMPGIQGRVSAAEGTAAPRMVGVGCLGFAPFSDFFVLDDSSLRSFGSIIT